MRSCTATWRKLESSRRLWHFCSEISVDFNFRRIPRFWQFFLIRFRRQSSCEHSVNASIHSCEGILCSMRLYRCDRFLWVRSCTWCEILFSTRFRICLEFQRSDWVDLNIEMGVRTLAWQGLWVLESSARASQTSVAIYQLKNYWHSLHPIHSTS